MVPSPDAVGDGCTGFQWLEPFFAIRACCDAHDMGGSDGQLLDCLMNNTPHWAWPLVGLCVTLMLLFRPILRLFQPKGSARN